MESDQFARLVSRFSAHLTRRRSLGLLSVLGVSGASIIPDVDAKKKKKKKKGKGGKKKPPTTQSPTTRPPTTAPGPTCTDGIRNGDETDVDCGGACPRCTAGKACLTRDDCKSAICDGPSGGRTCKTCTVGTTCAGTIHGDCICHETADGQAVCDMTEGLAANACAGCPAGYSCVDNPETGRFTCYPRCSL